MTLTDREKFTYFATSLALSPITMGLPLESRTLLLQKLRMKFCPTLKNADWHEIFRAVEDLRPLCQNVTLNNLNKSDMMHIYNEFMTKGKTPTLLKGDTDLT